MLKVKFSLHALERMAERNITIAKVEEILMCGSMYSNSNGLHRVKYFEYTGHSRICYSLIYSKSAGKVVTVWMEQKPYKYRADDDTCRESNRKFRQRKRAAREKEQLLYCREEMRKYFFTHAA